MARRVQIEILGTDRSAKAFRESAKAAGIWNSQIVRASRGAFAATVGFGGLGRAVAFASAGFIGTAGLATAVKQSTAAFVEFEDTMQRTVGLAGVAQDQVAGLSEEVLKLAPTVGVGPQELAKALYFVSSSGIETAHAMDVVTASAKASAAGLGDVQIVADAVTSAMNAYGQSNLDATDATNTLVAAVRLGKGEADALAASIGPVAALSAQLGVKFNEVGAALASQTRIGIDAQTAAINLQQVFTNLLKVTPQSAKAFKSVGLSASGLRDVLADKGFLAFLNLIKTKFVGNLKALANAFPNIRALRGLLALVGKQGADVVQVFDQMKDTSGSLNQAFGAVSQDAQQKFNQMKAGVQAAGIAMGAAFAPVAVDIADALAKASSQFISFTRRISEATGFHAKLVVVWEGISGAANDLTKALAAAVAQVDWNAVWSEASGIGDAIQKRLEEADWSGIGSAIATGIVAGVAGSAQAFKVLGDRFGDALDAINWEQLGRKIGPGLVTAILAAINAIADPSFWLRNWDLVLSVALVAFSGSIGRIAGKIAAPLVKMFGEAWARVVISFAEVARDFGARAETAVYNALTRLPAVVGRLLGNLVEPFRKYLRQFRRWFQFTIKVLGVDVAIHAIARFVGAIRDRLGGVGEWIERWAIHEALMILKPFSVLPAFLGGWARKARSRLQAMLDGMTDDTKAATDAQVGYWNNVFSATRQVALGAQAAGRAAIEASRAAGAGSINRGAGFTPDAILNPPDTGGGGGGGDDIGKLPKGWQLPLRYQILQARAALTKTIKDDVEVAKQIVAYINSVIGKLKGQKLLDALGALGSAMQTIQQASDAAAEAAKEKADALKLYTVPLQLELLQARAQALGQDLKPILLKFKKSAERALKSGRLGLQGQIDAWNTIANVNEQLKNQADALAKFIVPSAKSVIDSLHLNVSPRDRAILQQWAAKLGPTGKMTVPGQTAAFGYAQGGTNIYGPVYFQGVQNIRDLQNELTKERNRSRTGSRRGTYGGRH